MKSLIARIRRSTFLKNVAVLASGTALAQAIIVIAAPILSRLYDPSAFGIMSVALSVAGPLAIFSTLKYELAIVLVREDREAANLLALSCGLVVVFTLLAFAVMAVAGDWIAREMERPSAAPLMMWVPAVVFVNGVYNTILYWANRRRDYFWTSASTVSRSVGTVAVQIVFGLVDNGAKGLIVGRVIGVAMAASVLGVKTIRDEIRLIARSLSFAGMRQMARAHNHFPIYNAPREGIVAISGSVPSLFLALLFSPAAAGLYWFTVRLLEVPTTLIGVAVRRVFFERAAKAMHTGEKIYPLLVQATGALAMLGIIPVLVVFIEGPDLFDLAFGDEWRGAGVYARWLAIWWFSSFCNAASSALIPVFRLQPLFLAIEIVGLFPRAASIGLAVFFGDDVLAVALYSIVGFLLNVYRTVYVIQFAKYKQSTVTI